MAAVGEKLRGGADDPCPVVEVVAGCSAPSAPTSPVSEEEVLGVGRRRTGSAGGLRGSEGAAGVSVGCVCDWSDAAW